MAIINMTLQGKGGVGKSLAASLITQNAISKGITPICIDTDPVNASFAAYKEFNVQKMKLGDTADEINISYFDKLFEIIAGTSNEDVVIVDNGSPTFLPLVKYMVDHDIMNLLHDLGHEVRIHALLTGGEAFDDTLNGLDRLFICFPKTKIVVWLNEYFGKIEDGGKKFEDSPIYQKNIDQIYAILKLPQMQKDTFGRDFEMILKKKLTFTAALELEDLPIMTRQRLKQTWAKFDNLMSMAKI